MASVRAASPSGFRKRIAATTKFAIQSTAIDAPITAHRVVLSGVDTLK